MGIFRGLNFEANEEIGQISHFWTDTIYKTILLWEVHTETLMRKLGEHVGFLEFQRKIK